jgi:hypothetical protein
MYVLDFGGAPGVLARQAVAEHVHGNVADAEGLEDAVKALGDGANSATQTRMWVRVGSRSAGTRALVLVSRPLLGA